MRIGVSAGAPSVDRIVEQAVQAEADGFTSLWFAGAVAGDPMVAMALAGRATSTIELGTSVLQTYPCHPVLMANRVASVVNAVGRGITLGIGPSHEPAIEGSYQTSYAAPGTHTEEYVSLLAPLLRGEVAELNGEEVGGRSGALPFAAPPSLLIAALGSRLLRVAGEQADGTILWMANAIAVENHIVPKIRRAAASVGRPAPRIVCGLPLAVCDDLDAGREACAKQFGFYGGLPNYRRILDIGHAATPMDAAIIGDEESVVTQVQALFDAGVTDVWTAMFPVGDDRAASRARTRALLKDLASAP
jgi:F420-dependent oxidoreductase-like protein